MKVLQADASAQSVVKGSKFIAYLCAFKDFKSSLERLKKEHTKAVHFVWAWRALNEFGQVCEDKSDDFEPKNTAGAPCLNALRGAELIDTAVIVVRYFGGIKLGTGGLVRAYGDVVNLAINEAILLEFVRRRRFACELDFKELARVEHFLKKENVEYEKDFSPSKVHLSLNLSECELVGFESFAKELGLSLKAL